MVKNVILVHETHGSDWGSILVFRRKHFNS